MSGIALILDLMRKNPNFYSTHTLHSVGSLSAKAAVSGAAASVLASYPFGFKAFLGSNNRIAYCDAGTTWDEGHIAEAYDEHVSKNNDATRYTFEPESLSYSGKVYNYELKSLFSAFHPSTFALTALRSFLMFYLPLLEPRAALEDDDEDFLADNTEERHVDLITPFHKAVRQTFRESTVITTRRVLERLAVSYLSQRMAWKLIKDASKSAVRKAERGLPTTSYMCAVTRTTARAHCLGVAASWIFQVGYDVYKTILRLFWYSKDDIEEVNTTEELQLLGRKIYAVTLKCTASLIFAAIGAGLGASLTRDIHPKSGQWLGCAAGDMAGPVIVALCFDKLLSPAV